jgi:hypothetical protein
MFWTHRSFWVLPILVAAILGGLSAIVSRTRLKRVYEHRFQESRRERLFLASLGFFTTVLVVRALTLAIRHDIGPFHDVSPVGIAHNAAGRDGFLHPASASRSVRSMRGRHIHHLVWGILLLLLVGYLWLIEVGTGAVSSTQWTGRLMSMLFGVAAALTLDEFALWLNLRDVYWEREGRENFEALGLFAGLLALGIFGRAFWTGIARELGKVRG